MDRKMWTRVLACSLTQFKPITVNSLRLHVAESVTVVKQKDNISY